MKIDKDMTLGEIAGIDKQLMELLFSVGIHCVKLPAAQNETLEEVCIEYAIDYDNLMSVINETYKDVDPE